MKQLLIEYVGFALKYALGVLLLLCLFSLVLEICGCDSATEPESSGWFRHDAPEQTRPWPEWADTTLGEPVTEPGMIQRPTQPKWLK